jgi:hypothetical protein
MPESSFKITKVTGLPQGPVASGNANQPSANGQPSVIATGSTDVERDPQRRHLRLVQD